MSVRFSLSRDGTIMSGSVCLRMVLLCTFISVC